MTGDIKVVTRIACLFSECGGQTDLIFVADRSGSICDNEPVRGCDNWDIMLNFMANLIEDLEIGPDATRIGMVVYGNRAYVTVGLDQYDTRDSLRQAILAIEYDPNKRTNIADAITLMTQEFEENPRPGATQIGVVISDGISTINNDRTVSEAAAAREKGIVLFAIGVTDQVDESELQGISSEPQVKNRNYFVSPTFDALGEIGLALQSQICPEASTTLTVATPAPGLSYKHALYI